MLCNGDSGLARRCRCYQLLRRVKQWSDVEVKVVKEFASDGDTLFI
jgi:hypothetical protein